jgi:hypothetical protein
MCVSLKHYVHRVLSLPPRVAAKKIAEKAWRAWKKRSDYRHELGKSSYVSAETVPAQHLQVYLPGLELDLAALPISIITRLARLHLSHRFDLLGSGWVHLHYGMPCSGVEGHRYKMSVFVKPDRDGRWLERHLNSSNHAEARKVWQLIDAHYEPIDWQLDFKSGYRWTERDWYQKVRFAQRGHKPGVDIKVPWELSRMQHLPLLAYAYAAALRGTPGFEPPQAYSQEFRNEILDFIATNPPRFGVNWACTMDVAIRVANWLISYDMFQAFGARFDGDFDREFIRSVYQHGAHIVSNLEWNNEAVGNHYLADIVGLLFVAAYLPRRVDTDGWLAFSIQELIKEVERQFLPDGANFEASTSYHRLSSEMVVYATALVLGLKPDKYSALTSYDHTLHLVQPALNPPPLQLYPRPGRSQRTPFPDWYFQRIGLMGQFTHDVTRPDGRICQVGDCDNGRFFKLHPAYVMDGSDFKEDQSDHRHLLAAITGLTDVVPDQKTFPDFDHVDKRVVHHLSNGSCSPGKSIGSQGQAVERTLGADIPSPADLRDRLQIAAYPHFGLFIYKSRRLYLAIRCGRGDINKIGNHAHNDNLSFELVIGGMPIITDPGTYVYTPSTTMRNRFRSTAMHNTLVLGDREQNDWMEGREGLFQLRDRSNARVVECQATCFVGEHVGFGTLHRRELRIMEREIHGRDQCESDGFKRILFHIPPSLQASISNSGDRVELTKGSAIVRLKSASGEWSLSDSYHSNGYGSIQSSTVVSLETTAQTIEWAIQV